MTFGFTTGLRCVGLGVAGVAVCAGVATGVDPEDEPPITPERTIMRAAKAATSAMIPIRAGSGMRRVEAAKVFTMLLSASESQTFTACWVQLA